MFFMHFGQRTFVRIFQAIVSSAILLFVSFSAQAVPKCTVNSSSLNPSAPARIVVTSTVPANKVIYEGAVTANVTCTVGVTGDAVSMQARTTSIAPSNLTSGATNVSVSSTIFNTAPGPSAGYGNIVSGPCTVGGSGGGPYIIWKSSGTCTAQLTTAFSLYATATGPVRGTIPAAMTTDDIWGVAGWAVLVQCSDAACSNLIAPGLVGINGTSIPIQTLSSTCTLTSTPDQTVALPQVSTASFKGVGSTAGSTNLSIVYNCNNSGGAMSLSMAWSFLGVTGPTAPGYSLLANTGTATGLAVQIVDSSGAPITTGAPKIDIASVANGVNSLRYTVRYYQNATPVTAGSVAATATYTATYQ